MYQFLPLFYPKVLPDSFGGIIMPDARQYRKNIAKDFLDSNCRQRIGNKEDWISYATKFVSMGGVAISWYVWGSLKHLDLKDDTKKRMIITYDLSKLTNRMYHCLRDIIRQTNEQVDYKDSIRYILAQTTPLKYNNKDTVAVKTASYMMSESAILHLTHKISGGISNVVTSGDLVHSILRKDGLNA